MADEGIVSRAGMIQELVMVRHGLLCICISTDDFTQNNVLALSEHVCRLILYFYVFFCFLFVYLVYDFYINNNNTMAHKTYIPECCSKLFTFKWNAMEFGQQDPG